MLQKLKTLAVASTLSLAMLAVFSIGNDRGGILHVDDLLGVGRERVPTRSPAAAAQGTGCLPTTGTVSGLTFAQGVNSAIAALISSNSGASAPTTDCSAAPVKGQVWLDTSVTPNVERRYDGTNWVAVGAIDAVNHVWSPPVGGGNTAITAASTTNICAAPSAVQTIGGSTPITSFGSDCVIGARKTLLFTAATPITYNATSMILPAQRSYTTTPGDAADAIYLGSGNWRVLAFNKIDGSSVTSAAVPMGTVLMGDFATIPPKTLAGTGQAISRASYPDYFAAVTRRLAGSMAVGSPTITGVANTRGLGVGMPVEGTPTLFPAGTTIVSVTSSTITLSNASSNNSSIDFTVFLTGYGSGGDTNTVGVKNCAGTVLAGLDPAGARLSGAASVNAFQGEKQHTLLTSELPVITPTGSISDTRVFGVRYSNVGAGSSTFTVAAGAASSPDGTTPTVLQSGTITFVGTPFGSGNPHPIVQPTVTAECVVVVLP